MAENSLGNTQYFRTKPEQELEVLCPEIPLTLPAIKAQEA